MPTPHQTPDETRPAMPHIEQARRANRLPTILHYLSLLVAFGTLLWIQRRGGLWFVTDDWSMGTLSLDFNSLVLPHNEHWMLIPTVVQQSLYGVFGITSYTPYMAAMLAAHVALAHIIWRIMCTCSVSTWLATGMAVIFLFLGAGAENIVWAFQIGMISAFVWTFLAALLVSQPTASKQRLAAASGLLVLGVMTQGNAIPVVAAIGVLLVIQRGWRTATAVLAAPVAVYGSWLLLWGRNAFGGHNTPKSEYAKIPAGIWQGLANAVGGYVGVTAAGMVLVVLLVLWIIRRFETFQQQRAVPFALAVSAALLFLTVGIGRVGITPWTEQGRYMYLAIALLLALLALAVHELVDGHAGRLLAISVVGVGALVSNLGMLHSYWVEIGSEGRVNREEVLGGIWVRQQGLPVASPSPDITHFAWLHSWETFDRYIADGAVGDIAQILDPGQLAAAQLRQQTAVTDKPIFRSKNTPRVAAPPGNPLDLERCQVLPNDADRSFIVEPTEPVSLPISVAVPTDLQMSWTMTTDNGEPIQTMPIVRHVEPKEQYINIGLDAGRLDIVVPEELQLVLCPPKAHT